MNFFHNRFVLISASIAASSFAADAAPTPYSSLNCSPEPTSVSRINGESTQSKDLANASDQDQSQTTRGDGLETPLISETAVVLTEIASGLTSSIDGVTQYIPTDFAAFPDGSGRFAVMTLGGVVRIIDPVTGLDPVPYLNVVNTATEVNPAHYGMVSIVFHPDFAITGSDGFGKFYTIETESEGSATPDFAGSLLPTSFSGRHDDVLYEYTASDIHANEFDGSKREIFRVLQPGRTHNMFDLVFGIGDDRSSLYITLGDGDNAGENDSIIRQNAQFLGNVFGKVLRIDPLGSNSDNGNYGIPVDNPFVDDPDARPEIFSFGHRSPYRLTVDRDTGNLWMGEVGQSKFEEINLILPGANYGWPEKEGSFIFDPLDHQATQTDEDLDNNGTGDFADSNGFTDPIFELQHPTSLSITGGTVYRGESIPGLSGKYIFADAFLPGIYMGDPAQGPVANEIGSVERLDIDSDGVSTPAGILAISEDEDGELYILTFGGKVLRIERAACSPADFTGDGETDIFDVFLFIDLYNAMNPIADLNGDSILDVFDVFVFLDVFNAGCP